jgi:hypothetical protein
MHDCMGSKFDCQIALATLALVLECYVQQLLCSQEE